jgi:hypothetical protein
MKIVMTLLIRDEEDILRENILYHLSQGVDFFIATDNLSEDSSKDILMEFKEQGCLHYILEESNDFDQRKWVTRMARMAAVEFDADWVINNDADEFWWPLEGNLKTMFERIPPAFNILRARRHNFVPLRDMTPPFYKDMIYRQNTSLNPLGKPLPPKVAHRADPNVIVDHGNHHVTGFSYPKIKENLVEVLHFPIRTYDQFENKIKRGGAALARNKLLPEVVGITWRRLYDMYQKNDGLTEYFRKHVYDSVRLKHEIDVGTIIKDRRLRNVLDSIL